jgi:photosystem II stability/assembly factor-like uncharacterized protein
VVRRNERESTERKEHGVAMTRRSVTARCTLWFVAALTVTLMTGCASVSSGSGTVGGGGKASVPAATTTEVTATAAAAAPTTTRSAQFWPGTLDMTSASTGWALYLAQNPASGASQPTLVARTVDGARTWTDVTPPAARSLLAAKFATAVIDPVDSEHAYLAVTAVTQASSSAVPAPSAVFATADGGKTWTGSAPFTVDGSITQVVFADPQHGWLLTGGGDSVTGTPLPWLYRTTDGGLHWTAVASAPPPGEGGPNDMCLLRAITFSTATTGWVRVTCRSGDYLAQTADGGSTWSVQSLPALSACAQVVDQCMLFGPQLSDGTAYLTVTATQGSPTPTLLASGDLGQSWQELTVPTGSEQYPQVTFFGPDDGMLVPMASQQAYGSVFYTTTDGGQTWSPVPQGTHFTQLGATIDFATPQDGFSWTQSGDAPESTPPPIYVTTNSGATWTSFAPEVID